MAHLDCFDDRAFHKRLSRIVHTYFQGIKPKGLPLRWTSNDLSDKAYDELNTVSSHLFIAEIQMDCSGTGILQCKLNI